jgi:hypothetical protein
MKEIRSPVSNWREIAEHEVARAELQAEIELARLVEERKNLEERHLRAEKSLDEMGVSEAKLRAHETSQHWWAGLAFSAVAIAGLSVWWSVGWYLTLGWEKILLAVTVVVLPLVGWVVILKHVEIEERDLRQVMAGLGLAIVLASVVAGTSLALGRMAGTTFVEEQQAASGQGSGDLDQSSTPAGNVARAERVKGLLAITSMVAVLFLGLASEVAAGIAFDELMRHGTVVRTVRPVYNEREWLEERLAENAHLQQALRRRGKLARISQTIDGLRREEAEARQAIAAAGAREAEDRLPGLGPLVWKVAIAFAVLLVGVVALARWAAGEERSLSGTTVVLLDLSASTIADEFSKNLRAIEGVIRRVGESGRVIVFGITEASFGVEPLLRTAAPPSKGRFGERLGAWQETATREWQRVAASLTPAAKGTDVFGALARAAVECEGATPLCRLVILSDMRQVGRGINLERPGTVSGRLIEDARRQGLIPNLKGVGVWVLGVHTAGLEERQWQGLRAFWTEYFRVAGADVVAFTPNRRLGG